MGVRNRVAELIIEKAKRENRRITATEVARDVGMTRQNMSKWVNNNIQNYDSATVEKLCRYFGCTVGELLARDEDETQK